MFFHEDIRGDGLPAKSLCLTYDDGPGYETRALGRYLYEQGVRAAFFVLGRYAEGQSRLLLELRAWGHLIGNHTYNHPGLVAHVRSGQDAVSELAKTDMLIAPCVGEEFTFFRPPYGDWRERSPEGREHDISVVAEVLNKSGRFPGYVGPVRWDISAADYDFWHRGDAGEKCAEAYLRKIEEIGKGIVLMHDSSEDEEVRRRNHALEATRALVPALKARGFQFVSLDEVPQVRSACQASRLM